MTVAEPSSPRGPVTERSRRERRLSTQVVSPDRTRSLAWDGTTGPDNAAVFAGPDCAGPPLFTCTLVYAGTPSAAARAAHALGMRAAPQSLGAEGATGRRARHLYYCEPLPRGTRPGSGS